MFQSLLISTKTVSRIPLPKLTQLAKSVLASTALSVGAMTTLVLSGCGSDSDNTTTTTNNQAQVSVYVTDSKANKPVGGVAVFYSQYSPSLTSENGYARLTKLPEVADVTVSLLKVDYARQTLVLPLDKNKTLNRLNVAMLLINKAKTQAGNVEISTASLPFYATGGSKVNITYNNLRRIDGNAPTRPVTVFLTDIDQNNLAVLPGKLVSKTTDTLLPLQVFASTHLQLNEKYATTDEDNADVYRQQSMISLANETSVPVEIVAYKNAPATATLYYFDTSSSSWQAGENLTLTTNSKGQSVYTGSTSHTGYLIVAKTADTRTVTGCVADTQGNRLANTQVNARLSHSFYRGYSDSEGNFSLTLPTNVAVNLQAFAEQYRSNTQTREAAVTTSSSTNCLQVNMTKSQSATAKLTWNGSPADLDINVFLPTDDVLWYNNLGSSTTTPFANITTLADGSEQLSYARLLIGTHRLFVYNASKTFNPGITESGAKLTLTTAAKTFTASPAAYAKQTEVTQSSSRLSDTRSVVWYAGDMVVDANCNISFNEPDNRVYRRWLTIDEFVTKNLLLTGKTMPSSSSDGRYCQLASSN